MSRRNALDFEILEPLLRHAAATVTPNKAILAQVRALVKELVRAAKTRIRKKDWTKRLDAILDLVIDNKLTRRIRPINRAATRKNILSRLPALKKHGKRPGYVQSVEREILFQLTGERKATSLAQRTEFKSVVLLATPESK